MKTMEAPSSTERPMSDKGTVSTVELTWNDWGLVASTLPQGSDLKRQIERRFNERPRTLKNNDLLRIELYTSELRDVVAALTLLRWFR
jgi:hypothetical protein